ncbi:hypothetical protein Gasu2_09300 [Galdieria sulphuraria]|nr:hypothetical protein Gasu2_09300 [Galdieria sulphuraria]
MLGFVIYSTSPIVVRRPFFGNNKSFCGKRCFKCYEAQKSYHPLVAVFNGGGGVFGVGTSELVVIGIVAWIVLGPKRLYALSKDFGRIFGELKQSAEEAKDTLMASLENELEEPSKEESTADHLPNKTKEEQKPVETKLQEEFQREKSFPHQKPEDTATQQETVDKDRNIFLEQMERLKSSDPQPPAELPDILKKISTSEEETREYSVHSSYENADVDWELSALDKKYQELRNEIIRRKELQE